MGYYVNVDLHVQNDKGKWRAPTVRHLRELVKLSETARWMFGEPEDIDRSSYDDQTETKWYELDDDLIKWSTAIGRPVYAEVRGEDGTIWRVYAKDGAKATASPTMTWTGLPEWA